jgi:hypothetical protein
MEPDTPAPKNIESTALTHSIECATSIQCAQKEPSATGLSKSPVWAGQTKDHFIDLVSCVVLPSIFLEHISSSFYDVYN